MKTRTIETEAELEAVRAQVGGAMGRAVLVGDEVQEVPMVVTVRHVGEGRGAGTKGIARGMAGNSGQFVPCKWEQREVCVPNEQEGQDVPPVVGVELEKVAE